MNPPQDYLAACSRIAKNTLGSRSSHAKLDPVTFCICRITCTIVRPRRASFDEDAAEPPAKKEKTGQPTKGK